MPQIFNKMYIEERGRIIQSADSAGKAVADAAKALAEQAAASLDKTITDRVTEFIGQTPTPSEIKAFALRKVYKDSDIEDFYWGDRHLLRIFPIRFVRVGDTLTVERKFEKIGKDKFSP